MLLMIGTYHHQHRVVTVFLLRCYHQTSVSVFPVPLLFRVYVRCTVHAWCRVPAENDKCPDIPSNPGEESIVAFVVHFMHVLLP